jgi:hypothetical protein
MRTISETEIEQISGGSEIANACLIGGGVGAGVGSFFSPAGTAIGGLAGCGLGVLFYYL